MILGVMCLFLQSKLKTTLVDAKYDNFTRLIYDVVTPVWKLSFEKKKKLVHFGI